MSGSFTKLIMGDQVEESPEQKIRDEITPTAQEQADSKGKDVPENLTPYELDKLNAPPQKGEKFDIHTWQIDFLGGKDDMKFPHDLIAALENWFTKTETFLEPFIKQFATDTYKAVMPLAITYVTKIGTDPTIITNADKRNQAVQDIINQAAQIGLQCGETAALNILQAAYTHMNPEKAVITGTVTPTP